MSTEKIVELAREIARADHLDAAQKQHLQDLLQEVKVQLEAVTADAHA